MKDKDIVFNLRKRIFEEWRWKRYTWQEVKAKYGFSKKWFYKWLRRFLRYGEEGLKNKPRKPSFHPQSLSYDQKIRILDYVYDNPTHGPKRIASEQIPRLSGKTVWKFLKKENLNTRRKRRFWAEDQGKPTLTEKEKLVRSAKKNHVKSSSPGELISMDTFWLNIKAVGKVWQYTACDTYSSYGWARVYRENTSDNALDFFVNHMLKNCPSFKLKRVLTDRGKEFYSWKSGHLLHNFPYHLNKLGVKHTLAKKAHPWTNGYAERLNQTIWEEFYLCRLKGPYASIEALNEDLGKFMIDYNFNRRHTGYKLKMAGLEYPAHAFFDIRESNNIVKTKY